MKVKLTKKYEIDNQGNLYKNGQKVLVTKRRYLRIGKDVQQLAYWIGINFVPGYFEGAVIDHINSNTADNRPENLQWITQSENIFKRSDYIDSLSNKIREHIPNATHKDIIREINWYKRHNNCFRWTVKSTN